MYLEKSQNIWKHTLEKSQTKTLNIPNLSPSLTGGIDQAGVFSHIQAWSDFWVGTGRTPPHEKERHAEAEDFKHTKSFYLVRFLKKFWALRVLKKVLSSVGFWEKKSFELCGFWKSFELGGFLKKAPPFSLNIVLHGFVSKYTQSKLYRLINDQWS